MKNSSLLRSGTLVALLCIASLAQAQTTPVPTAGYWNLETNLTTRDYTTVRFYDGQDQLVYEETLPNLCLDLSRNPGLGRRTKAQLTATLHQVLLDPAAAAGHGTLLAAQLAPDRRVQRVYATR